MKLKSEMAIENSGNNKRIAKNTVFLYARMIIVLFVSIYTTRVVLAALGINDFGIYNVVCGFVSMFSFLNTSMSNGIQRFYNFEAGTNDEKGVTRVFQTALLIQIILAILLLVVLESIGVWYVNCKMVLSSDRIFAANCIFQFSVFSLILLILQVPYSAVILAYERMDYYAIVSIIDVFFKLGIVLALPFIPADKLIIYGTLLLFSSIVNFMLYYLYAKRNFKMLIIQRTFHKELFKSIFTFSGWNVMSMFAWMTQGQGINMVMNLFFGTVVNAARGISAQIQSAIQGFCENLVIAFRPQLVQSYAKGDINRTNTMMYSMSKIIFVMFFLLSTPVIFEIDYILHLWLGEKIPEYTSSFTILILLSMYPRNFAMSFAQVVHATGKLGLYQITSSIIILLALPLSYIALKNGTDANSVYWINLVICIIMFLACMFVLKKHFPFSVGRYLAKVICPCMITALISVVVPYLVTQIMQPSFYRLVIDFIVCSLWTMTVSYLIILTSEEKTLIRKMILRK